MSPSLPFCLFVVIFTQPKGWMLLETIAWLSVEVKLTQGR
jgi:hypothetical protein